MILIVGARAQVIKPIESRVQLTSPSKLFDKVTESLDLLKGSSKKSILTSDIYGQVVKSLNRLTVPVKGKHYVDMAGNVITLNPKDRFNLLINSDTESVVRVINGKVVFEVGENRTLPKGVNKTDIEKPFGKNSQGNIFIDSARSVSKSNGNIAIRSENCFFDETSDRSFAIDSSFTRCIDAMDNKVIRSPHTGIFLSHNNIVEDSAGVDSTNVDHKKKDKAYMTLSSGEELREIVTQTDPRTLIINIDGAEIINSPGTQVVSSELIKVINSPGVYAELASNGTVVKNSPLAYLNNVNSNDVDGSSSIVNSKLFSGTDANYIDINASGGAVLRGAHYAHLKHCPGMSIENSLHVHGSHSGGSTIDRSNRAKLVHSPNSSHVTSEGSQSLHSPGSAFNNADEGIIRHSENGSVTDSYSARITKSANGRIYDAEEGKLIESPGTQLKVGRHTTVKGVSGKLIVNRPYEKLDSGSAYLFPDIKSSKGTGRPGKTITESTAL